jgi:peptidoglycan/LPS O-acetylase OafA/YrhL
MKPTKFRLLIAVAIVAGAASYLLTANYYSDLPPVPLYGPVFLFVLAAAEGYTAATTSARRAGKPGTQPIHPITVARIAALAKATSPIGALAAGAYAGFLGHVTGIDSGQANTDVRTAAVGVAAGVVLTIAALAMERVCRIKDDRRGE